VKPIFFTILYTGDTIVRSNDSSEFWSRSCALERICVTDLLVTRTVGLVEIPSKSAVKSLSVLYYRLVSRIAESGSNRKRFVGTRCKRRPNRNSAKSSTLEIDISYVQGSRCNKSSQLRDLIPCMFSFDLTSDH